VNHGDGRQARRRAIDGFAQRVTLAHGGHTYKVKLPLVGGFQVQNAAVAAGLASRPAPNRRACFAALEALTGAKGRLEHVGTRNGAPIFIDYATSRMRWPRRCSAAALCQRQIGGGVRRRRRSRHGQTSDHGRIAAENADRVIVTDDNPRSENAGAIREAILAAAPGASEIGDRAEAIRAGIAALQSGDVLLIAGKGK